MINLNEMGQLAYEASRILAQTTGAKKNRALTEIAKSLRSRQDEVLAANALDMEYARQVDLPPLSLERLQLNRHILHELVANVERIAALPDPVGEIFEQAVQKNGLRTSKRRVPLGVIAMIYEARPTVTVDVATLCLKAGNATLLRGGNETKHSNAALGAIMQDALAKAGLPIHSIQIINDPARALVKQLLELDQYVDVLIPRGGASLQKFCRDHSRIPLILGGTGVCHLYVDQKSDLEKVIPVVRNAKVQLPNGCNAIETLLIHRAAASRVLPGIAVDLLKYGVELRVDEEALRLLHTFDLVDERIKLAQASDFGTEFLALILAVRIVQDVDEAIEHIAHYGTGHSDGILTNDAAVAEVFVQAVDSAAVFVNASTRFNDAGHLGLGAEIALSNQKLHARGPITLRELTTYKWVIEGDGHVRL